MTFLNSRFWTITALVLVLAGGFRASALADGTIQSLAVEDQQLDDNFNKVLDALTSNNLSLEYGFLYTPLMEKLSKGKGIDALVKRDEEAGPSILKTTLIKPMPPYTVVTTKDRDYVIIPTFSHFIMKQSSLNIEAHLSGSGYILAVRMHGTKKWEFVYDFLMDTDPINHQDARSEFFPDLPKTTILPERITNSE